MSTDGWGQLGSPWNRWLSLIWNFSGSQKKEGYQHRPEERPVREVNATVSPVPNELSGALIVRNGAGVAISESQATENERRIEKARKEIEALIAAKVGQSTKTEEPENAELVEAPETLVPGMIVMPVGMPPASWWQQFCQGSSKRLVERQAAEWAVQTLARETLGAAGNVRAEFETDAPISDVIDALERTTRCHGWQTLLKKAGLAS